MEAMLLPAVIVLFIAEVALFAGIVFREMAHYRQRMKVEKENGSPDESKKGK